MRSVKTAQPENSDVTGSAGAAVSWQVKAPDPHNVLLCAVILLWNLIITVLITSFSSLRLPGCSRVAIRARQGRREARNQACGSAQVQSHLRSQLCHRSGGLQERAGRGPLNAKQPPLLKQMFRGTTCDWRKSHPAPTTRVPADNHRLGGAAA